MMAVSKVCISNRTLRGSSSDLNHGEGSNEVVIVNDDDFDSIIDRSVWVELRESGRLCDGLLQTESGGEIKVHRAIMATCSPYFRALFVNTLQDSNCERYTALIPGISFEMLKLIVHYAYTGETLVTEVNVTHLLRAADQLNVVGMIKDCAKFLADRLCPENCIGVRRFAKDFFVKELEQAAHKYIMLNFPEVAARSDELLDLPLADVVAIFSSEELNVSNEKIVCEACFKWIAKDENNRKQHIVDLLKCVRLGLLETTYFMEQVKIHRYVQSNDHCKPLIIDTMKFLCDLQEITQRTEMVPTPSLARPRIPHDVMFAIGGWSGGSPTSIIETYDTRADRWVRVDEIDPSGARAYHKCVVVDYDIYIIGGFNGVTYFNSCRCFNVVDKTWKEISPMTTKRCYVSAAVLDSMVYAMGGFDGHHRQNTAERYDIKNNQWTAIAPMNAQRSDACGTTLNGRIYITGGFNGAECLSTCEFYDPFTNRWHMTSAMRNRRSGVSCISHAGCVFVLGGFNGISRLQSGERYDPAVDQWTTIPDMFNPRSNFAVGVIDNLIFAVGGFNGVGTISQVECFDEANNEWLEATDMNTLRSALAACVVHVVPNVRDYIHKNRDNLMEEKRLKLLDLQVQQMERERRRERRMENDDAAENNNNDVIDDEELDEEDEEMEADDEGGETDDRDEDDVDGEEMAIL